MHDSRQECNNVVDDLDENVLSEQVSRLVEPNCSLVPEFVVEWLGHLLDHPEDCRSLRRRLRDIIVAGIAKSIPAARQVFEGGGYVRVKNNHVVGDSDRIKSFIARIITIPRASTAVVQVDMNSAHCRLVVALLGVEDVAER